MIRKDEEGLLSQDLPGGTKETTKTSARIVGAQAEIQSDAPKIQVRRVAT
jgi:hypothetical protein